MEDIMQLDLNQEPSDQTRTSVIAFDSIFNELESTHERIEDRIRHLQAVTFRARQRQRWRQGHTPIQRINITGGLTRDNAQDEGRGPEEEVDISVQGRTVGSGKISKRNSAHLIAKALEMDIDTNKVESSTGSGNIYDCNICLDMARDPILTCCGHLFCWPCFYQLSYAYLNAKECPVCKGEVTETGIIPIYGNTDVYSSRQLELKRAGLTVPPRPHARRIESIRQRLISRQASSSAIQERILRFHNLIGEIGERVQSESLETATDRVHSLVNQSHISQPQASSSMDAANILHTHSHQISRLFAQGAASFSSLSSALNSAMDSAERLVEDLESYIHRHHIRRSRQVNSSAVNRDYPLSISATNQSESHTPHNAATNSTAVTSFSTLGSNDDATALIDSEFQPVDSSVQTNTVDPSSSSSGRSDFLRLADVDDGNSNEPRRRRLR